MRSSGESSLLLLVFAVAVFAACDTPGVTLIEPDRASGPDTVTFHVQLEDTALARALGWENGVPGAEVQLHRTVDPFQPHILHTDSTGSAYISNLLPGLYKIAGYGALSTDETAPTGGVIRAFGDGFKQQGIAGTAKQRQRDHEYGRRGERNHQDHGAELRDIHSPLPTVKAG
jgi:hypothetical protein